MKRAELILDRDYTIGQVDNRLYGSFIEHLGRAVYGGIYEPGHPSSDESGFRWDVIEMVRRLGVPIVRYPGGNFVSGFHWEDSVGPKKNRPNRLDLAWHTTETNQVGLHEFFEWAHKAGADLMYAVNLGTRDHEAAREIVEYANHGGGSYWSDLRRKNGFEKPLGIKLWCLGNEMDGPWQIGQKTAFEYGRSANEAAKVMKWVDPSIEVVACGSSTYDSPAFGAWELEMLEQCYDNVDYVSLHRYYNNEAGDTPSFLARSMDMDAFIKTVVSLCDAAGGKKRSRKKLNLSFDEWNIWYHSLKQDKEILEKNRWGTELPLLEDIYNFEDALVVGSMLITLLRNADRIKIACLAQLVNAIAPIMTRRGGGCWAQTIYWPFFHASRYGRGTALRPVIKSPVYDCGDYTDVPFIDAAAVLGNDGTLTLFVVNRDLTEDMELLCDLRAFGRLEIGKHLVLHHDDVKAVNTEDRPNTVVPKSCPVVSSVDESMKLRVRIPALSWNVIQFTKKV